VNEGVFLPVESDLTTDDAARGFQLVDFADITFVRPVISVVQVGLRGDDAAIDADIPTGPTCRRAWREARSLDSQVGGAGAAPKRDGRSRSEQVITNFH